MLPPACLALPKKQQGVYYFFLILSPPLSSKTALSALSKSPGGQRECSLTPTHSRIKNTHMHVIKCGVSFFPRRAARARPLDAARTYVRERKTGKKQRRETARQGRQEGPFAEYGGHGGRIRSARCRLAWFQVAKKKTLPLRVALSRRFILRQCRLSASPYLLLSQRKNK